MKFTRRKFIGTLGASTLVAASLGPAGSLFGQSAASDGLFSVPPANLSEPLNYLTSKHFEPFVNTAFSVSSGNGTDQMLVLKEVCSLKHKTNLKQGYSGESFSLLFEAHGDQKLMSGNLEFNHDSLGRFAFHTGPVGPRGTEYEVIVNRVNL